MSSSVPGRTLLHQALLAKKMPAMEPSGVFVSLFVNKAKRKFKPVVLSRPAPPSAPSVTSTSLQTPSPLVSEAITALDELRPWKTELNAQESVLYLCLIASCLTSS